MSGAVRSVTKVFKKVVKTTAKVLPVALGVGALVFTAGAALNVPGMAGGWGEAMSKLTSAMGATGVLGNVLTGALTQAGYGAVLGGAGGAVFSDDPLKGALKGAQIGAGTGAITGGVMGGLDFETDPIKGFLPSGDKMTRADSAAMLGGGGGELGEDALGEAEATGFMQGKAAAGPKIGPAATGMSPVERAILDRSWLERNQGLAGGVIGGLGSGIAAMASGRGTAEATEKAAEMRLQGEREARQATAANYANPGAGLLRPADVAALRTGVPRPTPAQRFDPRTYGGSYEFDPQSGTIKFVQNTAA